MTDVTLKGKKKSLCKATLQNKDPVFSKRSHKLPAGGLNSKQKIDQKTIPQQYRTTVLN